MPCDEASSARWVTPRCGQRRPAARRRRRRRAWSGRAAVSCSVRRARLARRRRGCPCWRPCGPARPKIWRQKAATEVLPLVPVTATQVVRLRAPEGGGGQGVGAAQVAGVRPPGRGQARDVAGRPARRRRPAATALGDEAAAVDLGARQGGEQEARAHLAAVGGDAGDLRIDGQVALHAGRRGAALIAPPRVGRRRSTGRRDGRGARRGAARPGTARCGRSPGRRPARRPSRRWEAAGLGVALRLVHQDQDEVARARSSGPSVGKTAAKDETCLVRAVARRWPDRLVAGAGLAADAAGPGRRPTCRRAAGHDVGAHELQHGAPRSPRRRSAGPATARPGGSLRMVSGSSSPPLSSAPIGPRQRQRA